MAKLHTNFTGPAKSVPQVDQDIDRYITAYPDGNFDEALKKDDRWRVFYHLSDMRTGLLGWYELPPGAEVLEIGAGFGALTGQLCDMAGHVTAVERSLFRARSLVKRWTRRENLDVYVGDFTELPFRRRFDLITLIGVLPRLAEGCQDLAPYIKYLRMLQEHLTPHGHILLAMDNRLGLKFFCGARDAHLEEPFGGLSGQSGECHIFTKEEICTLLKKAGYPYVRFYYPLPDYRLPQMIFSDAQLPKESVGEALIPYDPTSDSRVLSETYLYRDIIKNGLFPQMANSFLVECGLHSGAPQGADFISLAADREPAYNIATCIKGTAEVTKRPLVAAGREGLARLVENLTALQGRGLDVILPESIGQAVRMPFCRQMLFSEWLKGCGEDDAAGVRTAFDRLWAAILQASPPAPDDLNFLHDQALGLDCGVILRRAYVNMVPDNIFYDSGHLIFFNQGLTLDNCPARYVIFLALYESAAELERLGILAELRHHFDLLELWELFAAVQHDFVAKWRRYDVYHKFYDWAEMDARRMVKNRQILRIIGNE